MEQPVTVVVPAGGEGNTTADFQAGLATATAVVAAATAGEAEETAERAAQLADDARDQASRAAVDVVVLAATVAELEERMTEMAHVVAAIDNAAHDHPGDGAPVVDEDPQLPPIVDQAVEVPDKVEGDPDKPPPAKRARTRSTGFGSNWWFGDRR